MLESRLQPRNRPCFSPTELVRQAALLLQALLRGHRVAGHGASIITSTAQHELCRLALFTVHQ